MPFDLWAEEARVYLDHLGVPRHRLVQLFSPDAGVVKEKKACIPTEKETCIATEYFGLTQKERELLTSGQSNTPWEVWGFDEEGTGEGSWIVKLKCVPVFLERSGLSYEQLTDLLKTDLLKTGYINPGKRITVQFPHPDSPEARITTSPCDYKKATIEWPENVEGAKAILCKVHCFLRLQRKTRWPIGELDQVLKALGYDSKDFDDALLVAAWHIHELQNDLKVPLEELLSWFSPIDTAPGIYDRLFLNKSVQSGESRHFAILRPLGS